MRRATTFLLALLAMLTLSGMIHAQIPMTIKLSDPNYKTGMLILQMEDNGMVKNVFTGGSYVPDKMNIILDGEGKLLKNFRIFIYGNSKNSLKHTEIFVTLKNVRIEAPEQMFSSAIEIRNYAKVTMTLEGDNYLKGAVGIYKPGKNNYKPGGAGIAVGRPRLDLNNNSILTLKGTGSLEAIGGLACAAIGAAGGSTGENHITKDDNRGLFCGTINIEGGTITATGGQASAGIGDTWAGGNGVISISGGDITAKGNAAGIGGGAHDNGVHIIISGGNITAKGTNAGIGHGIASGEFPTGDILGTINISGGTINATGGLNCAGIGMGGQISARNVSCNILISGGNITAQGGYTAPGIGNGALSLANVQINIIGDENTTPKIKSTGGEGGAGIGTGTFGDAYGTTSITIAGGDIEAIGNNKAAGIGDGSVATKSTHNSEFFHRSTIRISKGTIQATGGTFAAGIGGGYGTRNGAISITGGTITALGGGSTSGGGAGIGSGDGYNAEWASKLAAAGEIKITGGIITSTGGSFSAGIGGGYLNKSGNITISGGTIKAYGTNNGSGIGSGHNTDAPDRIVINGGSVYAINNTAKDPNVTMKGDIDGKVYFDTEKKYEVFCTPIIVTQKGGAPAANLNINASLFSQFPNGNYGWNDVYTNEKGMLYCYLAAKTESGTYLKDVDGKNYKGFYNGGKSGLFTQTDEPINAYGKSIIFFSDGYAFFDLNNPLPTQKQIPIAPGTLYQITGGSDDIPTILYFDKGFDGTVMLTNNTIKTSATSPYSPFHLEPGAKVNLQLSDYNQFISGAANLGGIHLPETSSLTISGNGYSVIEGTPGIGVNYTVTSPNDKPGDLTINGSTIVVNDSGNDETGGIWGNTVTINGGSIYAKKGIKAGADRTGTVKNAAGTNLFAYTGTFYPTNVTIVAEGGTGIDNHPEIKNGHFNGKSFATIPNAANGIYGGEGIRWDKDKKIHLYLPEVQAGTFLKAEVNNEKFQDYVEPAQGKADINLYTNVAITYNLENIGQGNISDTQGYNEEHVFKDELKNLTVQWFTDKGFIIPWINATRLTAANGVSTQSGKAPTLTLYAKSVSAVTYHPNGGTGSVTDNGTYVQNDPVTVKVADGESTLSKKGFRFYGWCTDQSGNGTIYAVDNMDRTYTYSGTPVTFYAIWRSNVTYDANKGNNAPTDATYYKTNDPVSVKLGADVGTLGRTNFIFDSWNTQQDGQGDSFREGGTTSFNITNDTTLYAQWKGTVTYELNGGTGTLPVTADYMENDLVDVALDDATTKQLLNSGYDFAGWNTQANGTGIMYEKGGTDYFYFSGHVTLYAQWNKRIIPPVQPGTPTDPQNHTVTIKDPLNDCITLYPSAGTYYIESGSQITILLFLCDAYDDKDVFLLVNGETFYPLETDPGVRSSSYTFRILVKENLSIEVIELTSTGIESNKIEENKVYTKNGHLYIESVKTSDLQVYTIAGSLYLKQQIPAGSISIPMPKGIYLVRIDERTIKVIITD